MPAYSKSMIHECDKPVCRATATEAVFNGRTAFMGYYCARHAPQRVKELNDAESQPERKSE
jgi:hypothetical protein